MNQQAISDQNAAFWDNICGSHAAQVLGLTSRDTATIKAYDDWFLNFYPYLFNHVPIRAFSGQRVLEVGLGYGTLSQKIAESGADYLGLDIAHGPVDMVRERLRLFGLPGTAEQQDFLKNNLLSGSFDRVVAIGCFHHTGDIQGCISEAHRLLKPGGYLHCMVYNRYSHRHWMKQRFSFLRDLLMEQMGALKYKNASEAERAASDHAEDGSSAPETVYVSLGQLCKMLDAFSSASVCKENMDDSTDPKWKREAVLKTWGPRMGLDLYATARK